MYAWNSSQGGPDPDDARGVSEVLGIVLVLGMVIAATVVIVTVGATSFQQSQEQVSIEGAVTTMETLNERIRRVSSQPGEQATVALADIDSADLRVEKDSGWVNISLVDKSGKTEETTDRIRLGKIVYERGDQSVILQSGGVYRSNEQGGVATVKKPVFEYRYVDGDPTLTMSIIQLDGVRVAGNSVKVEQAGRPTQYLTQVNPVEPGQEIQIVVQSEFYERWHELFENQPAVSVARDHANRTASITLKGPPKPKSVNNALSVPGTAVLGGGVGIASYDSTTAGGSGTVGNGNYLERKAGDVVAAQDISASGSVTTNGDLYVNGSYDLRGGATINGDVYVNGTASSGSVEGSIYARDQVTVDTGMDGDVVTRGDVVINQQMTGNVDAGGDVFVNAKMEGDIVATGSVTVSAKMTGSIDAGGDVLVDGGPVLDDIKAGGDLILKDTYSNGIGGSADIGGDLQVDESWTTVLKDGEYVRTNGSILATAAGVEFAGNIYAKKDVSINGSQGTLATTGSATLAGAVDITIRDGTVINKSVSAINPANPPQKPDRPRLNMIGEYLDQFPDVSAEITAAVNQYKTNNNNASVPGFNSLGGNSVSDLLPAGNYYYEGNLVYGGAPSLTFDTTGGDIHFVVDGDFNAKNLDVDVKGDNQVFMYVTGTVDISGGPSFMNDEGRGDQFWLYAGGPGNTNVQAPSSGPSSDEGFYGVIASESQVVLGGGTNVYGAIVSPGAGVSGGQKIYFDEALLSSKQSIEGGPGTISYIQISTTAITTSD